MTELIDPNLPISMKTGELKEFSNVFLKEYLARGIGSLGKRDVDILVIHALIESGKYAFPTDTYKAAREMRISERRLKGLIRDRDYRYAQFSEQEATRQLLFVFNQHAVEYLPTTKQFRIQARQPVLRHYLESWVDDCNGLMDTSFNLEIAVIHQDVMYRILMKHCGVTNQAIISLLPQKERPKTISKTVTDGILMFGKLLAKTAGGKAAEGAIDGAVKVVSDLMKKPNRQ